MQGSLWISLLQRIPPAKHSMLVVVTRTGMELMVQRLFRLEEDFIVLRARLAGSSDQGRIILLPYDQLSSIAFNGVLPEAEVEAMFGDGEGVVTAAELQADQTASLPEKEPEAVAQKAPPEPPPANPTPAKDPTPSSAATPVPPRISKSVLLARLRARLSGQTSSSE